MIGVAIWFSSRRSSDDVQLSGNDPKGPPIAPVTSPVAEMEASRSPSNDENRVVSAAETTSANPTGKSGAASSPPAAVAETTSVGTGLSQPSASGRQQQTESSFVDIPLHEFVGEIPWPQAGLANANKPGPDGSIQLTPEEIQHAAQEIAKSVRGDPRVAGKRADFVMKRWIDEATEAHSGIEIPQREGPPLVLLGLRDAVEVVSQGGTAQQPTLSFRPASASVQYAIRLSARIVRPPGGLMNANPRQRSLLMQFEMGGDFPELGTIIGDVPVTNGWFQEPIPEDKTVAQSLLSERGVVEVFSRLVTAAEAADQPQAIVRRRLGQYNGLTTYTDVVSPFSRDGSLSTLPKTYTELLAKSPAARSLAKGFLIQRKGEALRLISRYDEQNVVNTPIPPEIIFLRDDPTGLKTISPLTVATLESTNTQQVANAKTTPTSTASAQQPAAPTPPVKGPSFVDIPLHEFVGELPWPQVGLANANNLDAKGHIKLTEQEIVQAVREITTFVRSDSRTVGKRADFVVKTRLDKFTDKHRVAEIPLTSTSSQSNISQMWRMLGYHQGAPVYGDAVQIVSQGGTKQQPTLSFRPVSPSVQYAIRLSTRMLQHQGGSALEKLTTEGNLLELGTVVGDVPISSGWFQEPLPEEGKAAECSLSERGVLEIFARLAAFASTLDRPQSLVNRDPRFGVNDFMSNFEDFVYALPPSGELSTRPQTYAELVSQFPVASALKRKLWIARKGDALRILLWMDVAEVVKDDGMTSRGPVNQLIFLRDARPEQAPPTVAKNLLEFLGDRTFPVRTSDVKKQADGTVLLSGKAALELAKIIAQVLAPGDKHVHLLKIRKNDPAAKLSQTIAVDIPAVDTLPEAAAGVMQNSFCRALTMIPLPVEISQGNGRLVSNNDYSLLVLESTQTLLGHSDFLRPEEKGGIGEWVGSLQKPSAPQTQQNQFRQDLFRTTLASKGSKPFILSVNEASHVASRIRSSVAQHHPEKEECELEVVWRVSATAERPESELVGRVPLYREAVGRTGMTAGYDLQLIYPTEGAIVVLRQCQMQLKPVDKDRFLRVFPVEGMLFAREVTVKK